MTTFTGSYLREPSDFTTVATEAQLIQVADDPSTPAIDAGVLAWSELDPAEVTALVGTLDPLIVSKEGVINGYLRGGGYTVPTDPDVNTTIREFAAKLVWNALRFRKGQLDDDALEKADAVVLRQLKDIASGVVVLVGEDTVTEPPSATVYAIGTSKRIFSRKSLEDM